LVVSPLQHVCCPEVFRKRSAYKQVDKKEARETVEWRNKFWLQAGIVHALERSERV
jgi:hypothetical protein